jgi:transposase
VHRQSVSRWARELEQSGVRGLRKAEASGRPAKPTPAQLRDLIEHRTGVRYHEDHVWRILRKLNGTCQRPTGKAFERDEQCSV